MNLREKRRIDYAKLNNEGVVVDLEFENTSFSTASGSEYETAVESDIETDISSQLSSVLSLNGSSTELDSPEITINLDSPSSSETTINHSSPIPVTQQQTPGVSSVANPSSSTVSGVPRSILKPSSLSLIVSGGEDLHEHTSEAHLVPVAEGSLPEMANEGQLSVEALTISQDIDDFLEENEVEDIGSDAHNFDSAGKKAEDLRTQYRTVHNKLKVLLGDEYEAKYGAEAAERLDEIKKYIKDLKKARKDLQQTQETRQSDCKSNKFQFLKKEFLTMAAEVEKVFVLNDSDWVAITDLQLTKRKDEIDDDVQMFSRMHDIIKDIMDVSTDKVELKSITDRYEKILSHKTIYSIRLYDEYKSRQIEERKAFDQAKLSIELPKFKGYGGVDIYTFKSDFEKLHMKSTPVEFQPDLLKNNYLENPALLLVKDTKDINAIWKTLKEAYGDCKVLLSNKVAELDSITHVKGNDPEQVLQLLSGIIHLMKELIRLAEEHKIEERLYHGSAMEKIQELIGDARFTRWLASSCEKDFPDEKLRWKDLLAFLEKEVKINQQKAMFSSKTKKKREGEQSKAGKEGKDGKFPRDKSQSHHQNDKNDPLLCFICGATDHVPTSGPKNVKLIQYFVCKKFVEMTNAQRLAILKEKNLCFQCLYPGADSRTPKHKEGKCQREFVCKHASHAPYDCKKHVLVCDDHKGNAQNIATFNDYKKRCVTRQSQSHIPDYAKQILIHHTNNISDLDSDVLHQQDISTAKDTAGNCGVQFPDTALMQGVEPPKPAVPVKAPVSKAFSIPVPKVFLAPEQTTVDTTQSNVASTQLQPVTIKTTTSNSFSIPVRKTSLPDTVVNTSSAPEPCAAVSPEKPSSDIASTHSEQASPVVPSQQRNTLEPCAAITTAKTSSDNASTRSEQTSSVVPSQQHSTPEPQAAISTETVPVADSAPVSTVPQTLTESETVHTSSGEQRGIWEGWEDSGEDPVYILQKIIVDGQIYNLFYDSGCKNFVSRHSAIVRLGYRAMQTRPGPTTICGVGGMQMQTPHGYYSVCLPRLDGTKAFLTGICMDAITETFPVYPLQGEVERDIKKSFTESGGDAHLLPAVEPEVGGDTDFMIGIKFNRHFPTEVYRCPISGLAIYRSHFKNASGGYGVVGGCHRVFTEIENYHHTNFNWTFLALQQKVNFFRTCLEPDVGLLGVKPDNAVLNYYIDGDVYKTSIQKRLKQFEESELVGSEIQYRCPECRDCSSCKRAEKTISIREEIQQDQIERSVSVDLEKGVATAELPFTADPSVKLCPNRNIALKVYKQQLKKINKSEEDKEAILKSEGKLQDAGFVAYVKDLSEEMQEFLANSPHQNFLPWLVAYKENSLTTPARLVFDAGRATATGFSINDILAKGANTLNNLLEIFIRFRTHKVAFHNDVNKMYNNVRLVAHHWCFQRYLFEPTLHPDKEPLEKVIMTVIYGVISSGNQATCALVKLADAFEDQFPEVCRIIRDDYYADDSMSGNSCIERARQHMEELEIVLNRGGFTLKSFTVSGSNPDKSVSSDGVSIPVAGHKWFSKEDKIALDIKELNFSKKQQGRKAEFVGEIPKKLTRRICTSKVAEVFDFSGLLSPITASWKVDLHDLVARKLDWDDAIPENLHDLWANNFRMMGELRDLRFNRAVVPSDAADLNISTLEFGDASKNVVCAAIYARFLRKCGSYSCQLILSKTRLVPDDMSMPRAELYAAVINTHTAEIVKKALGKYHHASTKFTDSQIVLFWLSNDSRTLKQWVRTRVIEVLRWTAISSWFYVRTQHMIADIATRRCSSIKEVDQDSVWVNGFDWMKEDASCFPTMTADEIKLNNNELTEVKTELVFLSDSVVPLKEKLMERYAFSQYVVDPNLRIGFHQVIRILALALKFIRVVKHRLKLKSSGLQPTINVSAEIFVEDEDVTNAETYFYRKASDEIRHFLKPKQYKSISTEGSNGVLYYSGRTLPDVTVVGNIAEPMYDLTNATFRVPLTDKHSPIAFSLVNGVHWNHNTAHHSGVETTWRYVLLSMFIIEGRSLVKLIRNDCQRCRYLEKRALAVPMGPVSKHQLLVAPAFYVSQVDLCGPFLSYSPQHKRTTIKVWLVVFCCVTTSATKIMVMETYCTTSFLQAFSRFACQVGYPKRLLTDEGGQLVKGATDVVFNLRDIKYQLHLTCKVDLDVCPVGGHNYHGKVERRIRHIRESLMKTIHNERLGILQWETVVAIISNSINNLPLALGDIKGDFELMDLITPNRLLLGRNNDRSPDAPLNVEGNYDKILNHNEKVFNAWFGAWLISHVPKLIDQPKWFVADRHLKEGDIVLFSKHESELSNTYQYGMVHSLVVGRDGRIREVDVRYRNSSEKTDRFTRRATRSLVVIHPVDEVTVMQELGSVAAAVEFESRVHQCNC